MLSTVKGRKQTELNAIGGKLEKEYEDRVKKMLNELRQVYEKKMTQNRDEFTKKYDNKVAVLQTMLSKVIIYFTRILIFYPRNVQRIVQILVNLKRIRGE